MSSILPPKPITSAFDGWWVSSIRQTAGLIFSARLANLPKSEAGIKDLAKLLKRSVLALKAACNSLRAASRSAALASPPARVNSNAAFLALKALMSLPIASFSLANSDTWAAALSKPASNFAHSSVLASNSSVLAFSCATSETSLATPAAIWTLACSRASILCFRVSSSLASEAL